MRGNSAEDVAERVLSLTSICGLQVRIINIQQVQLLKSDLESCVVVQPFGRVLIFYLKIETYIMICGQGTLIQIIKIWMHSLFRSQNLATLVST